MTTLTKIIVTSLLSFFLFSCNFDMAEIDGKGPVATKTHELENFNQILVENGWDVMLIQSETPKLVVKANENLHPLLQFSVENKALHIQSEKTIGDADAKLIQVYFTGNLQKIAATSGAEIDSQDAIEQEKMLVNASSGAEIQLDLNTNSIKTDASSGADVELKGTSENFEANASSGSEIDAQNLQTQRATADASSGAEVSVTAKKEITAGASSGGEVNYYGDPAQVSIEKSISGDVNKR